MPLLKIRPYLINSGSFTGSFSGTGSYARRALTASYVLGGAAGSSGTSGANGSSGSSGASGTSGSSGQSGTNGTSGQSGTAGSSGTSGVGSPGTSGTAGSSGTSSTATVQTGSLAKQTILYNVTSGSQNVITGLNLSSNKWGIDIKEEWDAKTITGDQYYNSCSLLLHCDGSNGSTTFTDNSPRTKTVTSNNGAAISTAQSKFGGASGLFDGTNDYLSIPNNAEFNFASGTFTVELWAYFSSVSDQRVLVTNYQDATNGWVLQLLNGIVNVNLSGNGQDIIGTTTILANTWYHITVSGTAGAYKLFLNGVQEGSTYTGGTTLTSTSALTIGQIISSGYFIGYIDELRITNGVARYTGNFTPSTTAFPNNAGVTQYATKYVGLIGGLNDSNVDYGVQKLSDSSLKVVKMTQTTSPRVGSGSLSGSVDRVYVNVLDYTKVSVTSSYATNALTASYVMGGAAGSSGTSGANGTSGSSGASGTSGSSGQSGTSGSSGTAGSSGTSGTAGSSGTSGSSGSSGTAGSSGTSGTSGATGAPGSSGTSGAGAAGTQGTSGSSGVSGTATVQTGSIAKQTLWTNVTSGSTNTISGLSLSSNKWDVSVVEEWDAATLDQYYNSCSLLCHFDSINPAGRFIDNSRNNFVITSSGDARLSTSQYKFGGASAYFDGVGDYLLISDNAALEPGSSDFTIECFIYPTANGSYLGVFSKRATNTNYATIQVLINSGTMLMFASTSGASWAVNVTATSSPPLNVWSHIAVVRYGTSANNLVLYLNGTSVGAGSVSNTALVNNSDAWSIGSDAATGGTGPFSGYIDELRITKGVARYTANFTSPNAPFPNSRNQVLTKYVGLVGGIDDKYVDYGVQKLSDTSLKLTRLTYPNQPIVGSGSLSGSVNRVYVNVIDYTKVSVTSSYSLLSLTASYALNGGSGGGSTLRTGSTYPITSSFSRRAITASYALNGGTALVNQTMKYVSGSNLYVLSRSIVSPSDVLMSVNGVIQTPITDYTVSASSVTFTESYPSGSKINARYLVAATNSSDVNLANIVLTGTTTGDAYYPQVAALLHFDGTNGSTTITDNSKNNYSFTATNGAAISTAQSKFGGASAFFDGTNDYIINNNANSTWTFLHNNTTFTLELWFYTSVTTAQTLISTNAATATIGFSLELSGINSRDIGFYTYRGVGGSYLSATSLGSVWSVNTWNHLAVVLNTSTQTVKIYLNGTEVATTSTSGFSFSSSDPSYALAIGRYQVSSPAGYYSGYIDELRITNGYARYTGNFTPSTTAFSNTGGDVGKALVVNSTATGVSIGTAGYFSSQLAKAWVNFNGTGTVAIRDSYNVSSITDNGTGDYTVNYSTALNNSNYAISGITDYNESGLHRVIVYRSGLSHQYNTLGVRIQIIGQAGSSDNTQDPAFASLMVLGN